MAQPLPIAGRFYVAGIILVGGMAIGHAVVVVAQATPSPLWLVLLALTLFSSTFSIKIPHATATISVSETFVFICALLYGPAPATLVIAVDGFVMSCWRRHRRLHQVLFNTAEPALSIYVAAHLFFIIAGLDPAAPTPLDVGAHVGALAVFAAVYFVLGSGLNALVVAIHHRTAFWTIWRPHFGWVLLNYCGAMSVAALLVHRTSDFNVVALGVVVPLLVISYLTFKTSMARVDDANRHLAEVNRLYLSTIETLAMAVDAKDQTTHGHIRRVQTYAVGLARALGLSEESQIKALEAAALLHDMGKLAIPEHILNKPGRLTPAEFEKMKTHATVGADILSAIDFPYPVVPIVRHHHERWDGRGYPDGLAGAAIPIGARILAVVDCYDALTSDRPYRRALSDAEAMELLLDDRGKAYDPLVVDMFVKVHAEVSPATHLDGPRLGTRADAAAIAARPPIAEAGRAEDARDHGDGGIVPGLDALHLASAEALLADVADDIGRHLRALTPAVTTACFMNDADASEIVVVHVSGRHDTWLRGCRIPVGERVSGWVAANRRTMVNSAATLERPEDPSGQASPCPWQSCLSTPLVDADGLVGVLTLYAEGSQAFTETDRRVTEQLARPITHLLRCAIEFERIRRAAGAQSRVGLPDAAGLALIDKPCVDPMAVIALAVCETGSVWSVDILDTRLTQAALAIRRDVRSDDALYRDGPGGLLIVLPGTTERTALGIADRARDRLADALAPRSGTGGDAVVAIDVGVAIAPTDGDQLGHLVAAARSRVRTLSFTGGDGARLDVPRQPTLFDERELRIVRTG